ncbi:MAG: hypothetical protein OCD00_08185 [Colwellia sp.]
MLLKFKVNEVSMPMREVLILITLSIFMSPMLKASERDFQLHGFIAQGVIDVNGSNFVNDDESPSTELTELGLNASYQLNSTLRLAGQVVYLNGGNRYEKAARVDYALLDWSVFSNENWQTNLYLGRFKNNHWLYSSSRDIPFARPSIILPQSVYFDGFRDIAVGSDGAAIKMSYSDDESGDFDFNFSVGTSPISDEQQTIILGEYATGSAKQDADMQASLYWQPVFSSWRFGLSLLESDFSYTKEPSLARFSGFVDGDFTFQFYTVNALYEGEQWEFSGEIYQEHFIIGGFYTDEYQMDDIGQGYYFQTRYKVSPELTLLARAENFYANKEDKKGKALEENTHGLIPHHFAFHKDLTLGASYDFSSNFRARVEYHWVKGGGRLTPVVIPNPEANNSEYWQMWAVQLMYWF